MKGCSSARGSLARPMARLAALATKVLGALAPPLASAQNGPCDAPEFRQFDFWLGTWTVRGREGRVTGTSQIERAHGGCVLHERYTTDRGYSGESLNLYDASRRVWHQSWVDSGGLLLVLEGGLRDGQMVLEGRATQKGGKVVRHRISWSPQADGGLRQLWEQTNDSGDWVIAFDGRYTRKAP